MQLSENAINNLRRLWVSPQPKHVKLAITMSNNAMLIHELLLPECILAKEFHPDLTTRLDIEDFLNKMVYGIELRNWREKIKFFQPPHQDFLYPKYKEDQDLFETYFLHQPHLFEKYKETAIHCSYHWGREKKLRIGIELFEKIIEKEPLVGDNYFFYARCHHYLYMTEMEDSPTPALKAYRKAIRLKTGYRGQALKEIESLKKD